MWGQCERETPHSGEEGDACRGWHVGGKGVRLGEGTMYQPPTGEPTERGKPLVSASPRDSAAGSAIAGGPRSPGDVGRRSVPRTPKECARG